jgi:hypothetical protein
MGWNDHDDRLDTIADILNGFGDGIPYPDSYTIAVWIRQEELTDGELVSESYLEDLITDYLAGESVYGCNRKDLR